MIYTVVSASNHEDREGNPLPVELYVIGAYKAEAAAKRRAEREAARSGDKVYVCKAYLVASAPTPVTWAPAEEGA